MTSTEVQRSMGERQVTILTRLQGEPQSFSHFGILPAGLTRQPAAIPLSAGIPGVSHPMLGTYIMVGNSGRCGLTPTLPSSLLDPGQSLDTVQLNTPPHLQGTSQPAQASIPDAFTASPSSPGPPSPPTPDSQPLPPAQGMSSLTWNLLSSLYLCGVVPVHPPAPWL